MSVRDDHELPRSKPTRAMTRTLGRIKAFLKARRLLN